MSRLPPFARFVPSECREVKIYAGPNPWEFSGHCRAMPGRLILPPDAKPEDFLWPVNGRECYVFGLDDDEQRITRLIAVLGRAGATVVRVSWGETPRGEPLRFSVFRLEGARRAA